MGFFCSKLEAVTTRGFAAIFLVALSRVGAQEPGSRHIRFVTVESDGTARRVVGSLREIGHDSLAVRLDGTDSVTTFARLTIVDLEEERRFGQSRAVTIGCLVAGVISAVVGYRGARESDGIVSQPVGALAAGTVGCGLGALVGFVLARQSQWRPIDLKETVGGRSP